MQISFTASNLDNLKQGALIKLEYWLKDDTNSYMQTFNPALAFAAMTLTDETSDPVASDPEDGALPLSPDSGSGCNTGAGTAALLAMAMWGLLKARK